MTPIELTHENFSEVAEGSTVPVLIDFWAPWCGPCRMIAPVIDEIAANAADFKVAKVNVDEQIEIAASLRVRSIPTLIVFKNGAEAARSVGVQTKEEILALLNV